MADGLSEKRKKSSRSRKFVWEPGDIEIVEEGSEGVKSTDRFVWEPDDIEIIKEGTPGETEKVEKKSGSSLKR